MGPTIILNYLILKVNYLIINVNYNYSYFAIGVIVYYGI